MNIARNTSTREIIEAETLRVYPNVSAVMFECADESCKIKLTPCSYQSHNVKRPYFKVFNKDIEHVENCKFNKYKKILDKANANKISESELKMLFLPIELIKPKEQEEYSLVKVQSNSTNEPNTTKNNNSTNSSKKTNSNSKVTAISRIVDFYLNFPYNRDVELNLLGNIKQYKFWFKKIKKNTTFTGTKIYFGQLHTGIEIEENESNLIIQLYVSEGWETVEKDGKIKNIQVNPFLININKVNLSSNKISRIKNELTYVIEEQKRNTDKAKKAFVFFLGQPSSVSKYSFDVVDGYLVSRHTKILPTK